MKRAFRNGQTKQVEADIESQLRGQVFQKLEKTDQNSTQTAHKDRRETPFDDLLDGEWADEETFQYGGTQNYRTTFADASIAQNGKISDKVLPNAETKKLYTPEPITSSIKLDQAGDDYSPFNFLKSLDAQTLSGPLNSKFATGDTDENIGRGFQADPPRSQTADEVHAQLEAKLEQLLALTPSQSPFLQPEADHEEDDDYDQEDGDDETAASSSEILVEPGTDAAALNVLIANAPAGSVITLANGLHQFNQSIIIARDDITLRGESEEETTIEFQFAEGEETLGIQILAGAKDFLTTTSLQAEAGTHHLTLENGDGIEAGTVLYIQQPNTQDYLDENGWDNVSFEDADERPFREFIVEVVAVEGSTVTLASALPYEMDAAVTKVFEIDLLKDVTLSDLTITHDIDREVTPNDFSNTLPAYQNTASVFIEGTYEANLENLTVVDAPSNAIDIRSSLNLTADDLYIDGAHNMGSGGNGYGIQLYETFDSTITDAEIYNVRHALLFSSWHAETGNNIEISGTNRDINFHGSPDLNNTVTVEQSILEYDPLENNGPTRGYWSIVNEGGSSHANTDPYENNTVLFQHAEGYDGKDIIFGAEGGAYLDGNGSQDTLTGGSGDDVIIGGTSKDQLAGGEGADTFVFEVGDSYDRISDFDGETEGDIIAFAGTDNQLEYDDLHIWQQEDDAYVRYGSNSTIILEEYDMEALRPGYFDFDWSSEEDLIG